MRDAGVAGLGADARGGGSEGRCRGSRTTLWQKGGAVRGMQEEDVGMAAEGAVRGRRSSRTKQWREGGAVRGMKG